MDNIRSKLPNWHNQINPLRDKLLLTDDIDSLLSCAFLQDIFNLEIKGFYNFNSIYFAENTKREGFMGVDLDSTAGRTLGNHITYYKNDDAINLNNYFSIKYYQKYPLNTALLTCWLYGVDLTAMTDEQLQVLLAIDSAFKGYYATKSHFKKVYTDWLDRLDIGFLDNRILGKMSQRDFTLIQNKYGLSNKIWVEDSQLQTNIELDRLNNLFSDIIQIELPNDTFVKGMDFKYLTIDPTKEKPPLQKQVFSSAWTYKNELKLSLF